MYGSWNPSELDDPDTTSVVSGENSPPIRRILLPGPGRLQHMCSALSCLSVREGRGETEVPVIFSQDLSDDRDDGDEPLPPQRRPEQEVWPTLYSCMSWRGQELPLNGLYSSASELPRSPKDMRNPKVKSKEG